MFGGVGVRELGCGMMGRGWGGERWVEVFEGRRIGGVGWWRVGWGGVCGRGGRGGMGWVGREGWEGMVWGRVWGEVVGVGV